MPDSLLLQVTAFADAASLEAAGDLTRPVPTCPDWSLRDLARHLGRVHRRVAESFSGGGDTLIALDEVADGEPPASRDEVATWLLAGGAAVASALADAGPGGLGAVEVLGDAAVLRDWLRVSGL